MTTHRAPLMDISNNDVTSVPDATSKRRKSGRAIRAPDKFTPDLPSSQAETKLSKRKRSRDDLENGASDIEEEDEEGEEVESDTTQESVGEEEVRTSRKRTKTQRKPAAKRAKVNGTTANGEPHAVRLPSRPKKASRKVAIADKDAEGLYAEVYTSGDSSEDVASLWLSRYKENAPAALAEVVNLVLRSAGCSLEVTEDDINDPDNIEGRIGDLQEEFQGQNITDYPLISKAKSSHAFRVSLVGFFDQLVQVMHASGALYEDVSLAEQLHAWMSTMSSSTSRPFRHTATLVALTLASSLCGIANKEIELAAIVQRQLEGETKRKGGNKARAADFKKKIHQNGERRTFLEEQIKDYFNTVYVHRYRDIDPKIRTECAEALGHWILTLPSVFFEGQYLRYMGWMLSDSQSAMRHEVVQQIQNIMEDKKNHPGMRHFIERFRPRLVEMATRDSEPTVRAIAVGLMDLIRQAGMLEPDDVDVIGRLIFDAEPKVRKALVGFFTASVNDLYDLKLEELGGDETLEDILNVEDEDYDSPRVEWIRFKCLAESLHSYDSQDQEEINDQVESVGTQNTSGLESRFTLAAQTLYENFPNLKDWEMLAGYLLFDHTSGSSENDIERALRAAFKPEEKEELILLEVLNAVVKMSLTQSDETEKSKDKSRKRHNKAEAQEVKASTARRLAGIIPKLLKKYGADPNTVRVVLQLEHVLNLGVFQELRQDSTVYAQLLDEISTQFNGHADRGVLREAGAALLHARGYEELGDVTENKLSTLWEDAIDTLQKIKKSGQISVRGGLTNKILLELSHNLARLEELSSISNPIERLEVDSGDGDALPIAILLDAIERGRFEDTNDDALEALEDAAVFSAIRTAMFYFMWKVKELKTTIEAGEVIEDLEVDQIREWQEKFFNNLITTFSSRSSLDQLRLNGAGIYLDAHVLFANLRSVTSSKSKIEDNVEFSYVESLIKEIGPEVQQELTSIFEILEKQLAKKAKKKLAEPDDDEAPEDLDSEPEEEEDDDDFPESERQANALRAEQKLCEMTGRLVLGIRAQVIDVSAPLKGKLQARLQRNRLLLGPNFKEVVAYLDEIKPKAKKSHKSKAQQAASSKKFKSVELIEEEEEEEEDDDPFADDEAEEGTVEDLRRRELLDEEPEGDLEHEAAGSEAAEEDDDDVMGD